MKIITKQVQRKDEMRPAYYKGMNDGHPVLVLNKNLAVELPDDQAGVVLRQLNQAYGGGFEFATA